MTPFEEKTITWMITFYCQRVHGLETAPCRGCMELLAYAQTKSAACPHGKNKPVCSACTIHCYDAAHREAIRQVMRFSGPRILFHRPLAGVWYLLKRFGVPPVI